MFAHVRTNARSGCAQSTPVDVNERVFGHRPARRGVLDAFLLTRTRVLRRLHGGGVRQVGAVYPGVYTPGRDTGGRVVRNRAAGRARACAGGLIFCRTCVLYVDGVLQVAAMCMGVRVTRGWRSTSMVRPKEKTRSCVKSE